SSILRTRGVIGTWPISQNPPSRITCVATAMAQMAMMAAYGSASLGVINETPAHRAGEGAANDEPPAGYQTLDQQRDNGRYHPRNDAARSRPDRHQHGDKIDRDDEVESEAARISDH